MRDAGAQTDLYLIGEDGNGLLPLATTTDPESYATVTSAGRIIFHRSIGLNFDIYSINADGSGLVALADTADIELVEGVTNSGRVIFKRLTGGFQFDLYSINVDGSGLVALAGTPRRRRGWRDNRRVAGWSTTEM